jgi:hypothetical protein
MYAIVLSFDQRSPFVDLLLKSYEVYYPNCPFIFRVPYNNGLPKYNHANVQFINTPSDIRSTMEALLKGIPDDEFVYWCFDDVYPVCPVDVRRVNKIYSNLLNYKLIKNIDAVRLINVPSDFKGFKKIYFDILGVRYFLRSPYQFYTFWFHHFVRAGVLRRIFLNNLLRNNYMISEVEKFCGAYSHFICIPQSNLTIFGETARKGPNKIPHITANCREDLNRFGIVSPNLPSIKKYIYNNGFIDIVPGRK